MSTTPPPHDPYDIDMIVGSPDDSLRDRWRWIARWGLLQLSPLQRRVALVIDDCDGNQFVAREHLDLDQTRLGDALYALQRRGLLVVGANGYVRRRYNRPGLEGLMRATKERFGEPPQ